MKFLNKNKVICLGAHPDDVEYGMSGTFGECDETEFFVIVLSNGGDFDETTGNKRNFENENIWSKYENVSGILDVGFVKSKHQDAMVNFHGSQCATTNQTALLFYSYSKKMLSTSAVFPPFIVAVILRLILCNWLKSSFKFCDELIVSAALIVFIVFIVFIVLRTHAPTVRNKSQVNVTKIVCEEIHHINLPRRRSQ